MRCAVDTNKPLIAILLAVYEPRMDWLKELLESLNAQTYPNLMLYVRDDASVNMPFEDIKKLIEKSITAFPYVVDRNEINLGSNKTFEILTRDAKGEYFAYCDQDDIWYSEKLSKLVEILKADCTLAYSDMAIINARGIMIAQSLKEIRPRLKYVSGKNLAETYFFRNCTAGCSMLVRSDIAKMAVPFPKHTIWDHWVAIVAATKGSINYYGGCLSAYRQHDSNQTGIMTNVSTRSDYYRERIEPLEERMIYYSNISTPTADMREYIKSRKEGRISGIWKHRKISLVESYWEIASIFMPDKVYDTLLRIIKN